MTSQDKKWQVIDVLQEAGRYLNDRGIENPRLNAERILAFVLKLTRVELYVHFEKPVNQTERETYKRLLRERAEHKPLQYIIGESAFHEVILDVNESVLIPRPETEILVENAIRLTEKISGKRTIRCLDIGTGSGNIAIAVTRAVPDLTCTAVDISEAALKTAEANAVKNSVSDRISFQVLDIMDESAVSCLQGPFELILSNPPYVTESEYAVLPEDIRKYEPAIALKAGSDGLDFYRRYAKILPDLQGEKGLALFEIGETQGAPVCSIFSSAGFHNLELIKDYNGKDRIIQILNGEHIQDRESV